MHNSSLLTTYAGQFDAPETHARLAIYCFGMARARRLLEWFDRHQRVLPWREDRDAYRVWVSEIMLQQTRVDVVVPYFERFVSRFPSVYALAEAGIDEVLSHWSGLGYYRRGRQLHEAACRVAAAGSFPRTVEGLMELPGIGPYTAAAVASIAFGVLTPVLDGNVERVLSRQLALRDDPKAKPARRTLFAAAEELLDPIRPGDSNQAMMELGATVCVPRQPRCGECPLAADCKGRSAGDPESYPAPRRRRETVRERRLVVLVEDRGRVLLFRRQEDATLLAGLWELPWVEIAEGTDAEAARGAIEDALRERYGCHWRLLERAGEARHSITFRAIALEIFRAEVRDGGLLREGPEAGWFGPGERPTIPVSSLVDKVIRAAAKSHRPVWPRLRA